MTRPVHTPYDGSAEPFTIGLKPLDPTLWLEVDDDLPRYLDEKDRLWRQDPQAVFAATPASRAAQDEVLALVADHATALHPDIYRRKGDLVHIGGSRDVDLGDADMAPLVRAAMLIQEDLVVMLPAEDGWRLAAASLSFPSSWSLAEKFDRPMHAIHGNVPGFGPGTRNAVLIDRMFSKLKPELPVYRLNWSLYRDDQLYHPSAKSERTRDEQAFLPGDTFVRVERQTLRRLPTSGGIVFTIRIYVDPVAALVDHDRGADLIAGLSAQLGRLDGEQLAYKGLSRRREALSAMLGRAEALAASRSTAGQSLL